MGMVLVIKRATDADLQRLRQSPPAIHRFLDPEADEAPPSPPARGVFGKLNGWFSGGAPAAPANNTFDRYSFDDEFEADKMWHGLYFLLTGSGGGLYVDGQAEHIANPAFRLLNNPQLSNEEVGYGAAWSLSSREMQELSRWLDGLDPEEVLGRFDGRRMKQLGIYPDIWTRDDEDFDEYLSEVLDGLTDYCRQCATNGYGAVVYIS